MKTLEDYEAKCSCDIEERQKSCRDGHVALHTSECDANQHHIVKMLNDQSQKIEELEKQMKFVMENGEEKDTRPFSGKTLKELYHKQLPPNPMKFKQGDKVNKCSGDYKFIGTVT